jgi:hypothetical protein
MDPDSVNPDPKHCHKSGHKIGAGQKVGTYYQIKLALGLTISLGIYFTRYLWDELVLICLGIAPLGLLLQLHLLLLRGVTNNSHQKKKIDRCTDCIFFCPREKYPKFFFRFCWWTYFC